MAYIARLFIDPDISLSLPGYCCAEAASMRNFYINRASVGDRLCFASRLAGSVSQVSILKNIDGSRSNSAVDSGEYHIDFFASKNSHEYTSIYFMS